MTRKQIENEVARLGHLPRGPWLVDLCCHIAQLQVEEAAKVCDRREGEFSIEKIGRPNDWEQGQRDCADILGQLIRALAPEEPK